MVVGFVGAVIGDRHFEVGLTCFSGNRHFSESRLKRVFLKRSIPRKGLVPRNKLQLKIAVIVQINRHIVKT